MRIVKEWLEDFAEMQISAEDLKASFEAGGIPIKSMEFAEEGFTNLAHLGPQHYVLVTEDGIDMSYRSLGRLLSVQNGCPYLAPEPYVTGRDLRLSEEQKMALKRLAGEEEIGCFLLIEADMPEVPQWMKRRLNLADLAFSDFADGVLVYVNAEFGSDIFIKSRSVRAKNFADNVFIYCCQTKSDINILALKRIRQIWEQHVKTSGFMSNADFGQSY